MGTLKKPNCKLSLSTITLAWIRIILYVIEISCQSPLFITTRKNNTSIVQKNSLLPNIFVSLTNTIFIVCTPLFIKGDWVFQKWPKGDQKFWVKKEGYQKGWRAWAIINLKFSRYVNSPFTLILPIWNIFNKKTKFSNLSFNLFRRSTLHHHQDIIKKTDQNYQKSCISYGVQLREGGPLNIGTVGEYGFLKGGISRLCTLWLYRIQYLINTIYHFKGKHLPMC